MNSQENLNPSQNKLPHGEKPNSKLISYQESVSFSGPLPHPSILQGYENILPGLADRITKMAESQSEHRKKLESRVITLDSVKSVLGLIFAFLVVLAGLGAGVYIYVVSKSVVAGLFSFIPLGTIVAAFIYQERGKKTLEDKQD